MGRLHPAAGRHRRTHRRCEQRHHHHVSFQSALEVSSLRGRPLEGRGHGTGSQRRGGSSACQESEAAATRLEKNRTRALRAHSLLQLRALQAPVLVPVHGKAAARPRGRRADVHRRLGLAARRQQRPRKLCRPCPVDPAVQPLAGPPACCQLELMLSSHSSVDEGANGHSLRWHHAGPTGVRACGLRGVCAPWPVSHSVPTDL